MQKTSAQHWILTSAVAVAVSSSASGVTLAEAPGAALTPAAPAAVVQSSKPVTIDDVLNLKTLGSAVVSPDGTQVLYTSARGRRTATG